MGIQENERLYIDLKKKICNLIYQGIYQEDAKIPPERVLAEEFEVSRITVRKALELLEEEHLIIREVGRGTRVNFVNKGTSGNMDMVALVAPARGVFFSKFIEYFQKCMAQHDSLLLYVEKPERETIENCLYRLYQKEIRNVVVWLDDVQVEQERLKRLRALGMNMVFFDTDAALPYADCVYLNNENAMRSLTEVMHKNGKSTLEYIGWDKQEIYSVLARRQAFLRLEKKGICHEVPWKRQNELSEQMNSLLKKYQEKGNLADAIICGSGEIGIEAAKTLRRLGIRGVKVASVDEFENSAKHRITTYGQDFVEIANVIYECLRQQNENGDIWKAECYPITGILIER